MKFSASVLSLVFVVSAAVPGAEYGGKIEVRQLARATTTADGQPIRYPMTNQPEVTAVLVSIPPGGETGWHRHPIPVYAYVLQGTLEVELEGGRVRVYRQGEAIIEVVDTFHNGRAQGETPVEIVAFYTGEKGAPNTVMRH